MELLPLITIPLFYFLVAFTKPYVQPKVRFNICAICVAVNLTWLTLLGLWLSGWFVPIEMIAILMGMSVAGIMYKMEGMYKKEKIRNFWFVRLVLIMGGYAAIYELLHKQWDLFLFISVSSLILMAIASLLFQRTTHRQVLDEQKKMNRKESFIKRLDNCC